MTAEGVVTTIEALASKLEVVELEATILFIVDDGKVVVTTGLNDVGVNRPGMDTGGLNATGPVDTTPVVGDNKTWCCSSV